MFAAHITACKFEKEDNEVYSSSTHNTKISDDSCCMKLLLTHAVLNSTIHSTHLHGTFSPRALKQGSIYLSNKNHITQKCYMFFWCIAIQSLDGVVICHQTLRTTGAAQAWLGACIKVFIC